jgi:iron complex outermembrane receptor protein
MIRGTVTATDGTALPGASVLIIGTVRGTNTNQDGEYVLTVPPGVYVVRARLIGYEASERQVTVATGATVTLDFQLAAGALLLDEVVVTGSRTTRTVTETPVPVDVIPAAQIRESGQTEVNQILAFAAPSFNASYQTIGDGTDHVNPASLRGLGPDQVLVLINGKRRHTSALVHVNGTFGRGTVGVDLNAIPPAAIERIEVLRDGAAAQYGSDAIAGVVNIVLKEQVNTLEFNTLVGTTLGTGDLNRPRDADGEQVRADVNFGFPIGVTGFFNVTAEFLDINRTNRSDLDTRDQFPGISGEAATDAALAARGLTREDISMKIGQGFTTSGMAFFNAGFPLTGNADFYSFGGVSHRNGEASGFYRRALQEAQVVPEIVPNGFLPEIHTQIFDGSVTAGMRGTTKGWDLDLSLTHGRNSFQFNIENSVNASMGTSSPTTFDAGRLNFSQSVGNFDAVRLIDTKGALRSLSLVLGGEFRVENYRIDAGETASWILGNGGDVPGVDFDTTSTGAPKNPGSQVFPGFQPSNEVDRYRNSISAYTGLEIQATDQFLLDVGGRFESYSDFGNRLTGKIAARYRVSPEFALRGAVSSGFRAPSLHQAWFNNVSIQFVLDAANNLVPARVLTSNNQSQVTKAFGIPDLKEETSVNVSAGFTARPIRNFSITADLYSVTIDDRIVFTSRFTDGDPIVATVLQPFQREGVSQVQFFANAVDTKTLGLDIVAEYTTRYGRGLLTLTGAANFTDTDVKRINVPAEMAAIFAGSDPSSTLFNREEFNRLETALPRQKAAVSAKYAIDRFTVIGRANYFGKVLYRPATTPVGDNDESFGGKALVDLDFSYEIVDGVRLTVGANNIFNTFPDKHEDTDNLSSGRFPYSRRVTQFGMNGGFYYGRLQLTL